MLLIERPLFCSTPRHELMAVCPEDQDFFPLQSGNSMTTSSFCCFVLGFICLCVGPFLSKACRTMTPGSTQRSSFVVLVPAPGEGASSEVCLIPQARVLREPACLFPGFRTRKKWWGIPGGKAGLKIHFLIRGCIIESGRPPLPATWGTAVKGGTSWDHLFRISSGRGLEWDLRGTARLPSTKLGVKSPLLPTMSARCENHVNMRSK